jgi:hypothetical protein
MYIMRMFYVCMVYVRYVNHPHTHTHTHTYTQVSYLLNIYVHTYKHKIHYIPTYICKHT